MNGQVIFFYADDLNCPSSELLIKGLLSNTSEEFYPPSALWINCTNYTYRPHSNECGPRTLLALTIMLLHPDPTSSILLPFMHHNIANIARTWVASTLVSGHPLLPEINPQVDYCIGQTSLSATSVPAHLITWGSWGSHTSVLTHDQSQIPTLSNPTATILVGNEDQNNSASSLSPLPTTSPSTPRQVPSSASTVAQPRQTQQRYTHRITDSLQSTTNITKTSKVLQLSTHDRTQPKITSFLSTSTTSRHNSMRPTQLNKTNKPKKSKPIDKTEKSKGKPENKPITRPSPLPSLNDFPIRAPPLHTTVEELPLWGHALDIIDPSETLRIILQNPNGVKPIPSDLDFHYSLSACNDIGASIICLSEMNTSWNHFSQISNTKQILKRVWQHSALQISQCSEKIKSTYQPGGTAMITANKWTSRIKERGKDPFNLGRWSYMSLIGSQDRLITIITAYRVGNTYLGSTGGKTAYKQQFRILSSRWRETNNTTIPNPHRQCIIDLQSWIESLIRQNHDIILTLDNNEDIASEQGTIHPIQFSGSQHPICPNHDGSLSTLIKTCGLVDILGTQHLERPIPPTYSRGKKRLDYILVSGSILTSVLKSGILPYNSIFHSDHRACYIDIDPELLFKSQTYGIETPRRRGLQLSDPRKVSKYKNTLHDQLEYHKIVNKYRDPHYLAELGEWKGEYEVDYEKVNKLNTEGMRFAEKTSSTKHSNRYDWSPPLIQAVQAVRYWQLLLKRSKGKLVAQSTIDLTRAAADLPLIPNARFDRPTIVIYLREARKLKQTLQKTSVPLRKDYLMKLSEAKVIHRAPHLQAAEYTQELEIRMEKELKELIKREEKKRQYKKIGRVLRDVTATNQGLSRIFIPASDTLEPYPIGPDPKTWKGAWLTITDPCVIAKYICAANTRQYNQAEGTPFGSGYLADALGKHAASSSAESLLQGTFTPAVEQIKLAETLAIIQELGTPMNLSPQETKATISVDDFISTYKVVKEATSSSPSGHHVGHYKAAATDPLLSELHSSMMSIPYMAGFSPSRWQTVTDVMLEKNPGSPQIHRLRIIALFESDFNQANRILFARQLGFKLEDNNLIPTMQYGSRPGKQCISAVLNKQLTYNIARQAKATVAFIENDAVGCYDRLINPQLLLKLRRLGASPSSTLSLSKTWSNTMHFIKTQFGTSTEHYSNNATVPLFGPGQGSTIGPFLWLLCFCLIADLVGTLGIAIKFSSVDHSIHSSNTGDAFVDDSYLGASSTHTSKEGESFTTTQMLHQKSAVAQLQILSQKWEKLLFSTGGAKSFWVLLGWHWSQGKAIMLTPELSKASLRLTEGYNSTPITIPRLSPYNSYRTLGVYISPSGSCLKALKVLRSMAEDYASKVIPSTLTRDEALTSYLQYFIPKIGFSLPALALTEKQCTTVQAPALTAFLPKIHLNQHTARSIIHGPTEFGGLNIPRLFSTKPRSIKSLPGTSPHPR